MRLYECHERSQSCELLGALPNKVDVVRQRARQPDGDSWQIPESGAEVLQYCLSLLVCLFVCCFQERALHLFGQARALQSLDTTALGAALAACQTGALSPLITF